MEPRAERMSQPDQRVIVTTDPELDDLNSMLRLLLYSNEIDLVGLVYSSSQHHFAGDAARGLDPHRWPAADEPWHIDRALDRYELAYPNLVRHDPSYPAPQTLRDMTCTGNIVNVGEMDVETPGSDLIAQVLLDNDPRPVFVQAWGGTNTIARALRSIEEVHSASPDWDVVSARIAAKTVITSFGFQDSTFEDYIAPTWPSIEHRQVSTMVWGYFAWDVLPADQQHYLGAEWTRSNVSRVGPIGAAYRVWGDGMQMATGFDDEDYFGVADNSVKELKDAGYLVWCPPRPAGSWISEGDSSNFALHIDNGLRSWEHPNYGGWGGRQPQVPGQTARWDSELARDIAPDGSQPKDFHAWRWFEAFQNDFAARLRWSVTDDACQANHHPTLRVVQGLAISADAGSSLALQAEVSDPDGDAVEVVWWPYGEAGTCQSEVLIEGSGLAIAVQIPSNASSGETIHVIAEATDDGVPALKRYARVIITIR